MSEPLASDGGSRPRRRTLQFLGRGGAAGLLRRASWNLIDQVLSALTNFVLVVVVARVVHDKVLFGGFSTALLAFSFFIGLERALVGQVLGIRHSDLAPDQMRVAAERGLGTVAVLGLLGGGATAAAGVLIAGPSGPALITVGVLMAPLLMQDTCRMIFFAQGRPALAALNDAVWAVVQFCLIGVFLTVGLTGTGYLVLAWGGAAAVGVLLATVQLRAIPRPAAAVGWCREHAGLVGYLLPETLLSSGGLQASTLLVGGIVGAAAVGFLSGASKLLGPLLIVSSAVMSFALPELSRRKDMSARTRWWAGAGMSAAMALGSLLYLAVLLILPSSAGESLFPRAWDGVRSVLLPMGLFSVAAGTCFGPALVIISMGQAKKMFHLTVLAAPLVLTMMPLGAVLGGAQGAAWGQLAAQAVQIPFWFWTLHRILRQPPSESTLALSDPVRPETGDPVAR